MFRAPCAHHQEIKIVLYGLWYHHTYRRPSGAQKSSLNLCTGVEQWSASSSPRHKKVRQVKSNIKTMLIAFFDIDGLVHHECVLTGQTLNKEFYKTVLQRLRDSVRRLRPEKWRSGNWTLHHDNVPVHRTFPTNEFLAKNNIPSLPQPPFSPDLAPCDFCLFPQLKKTMKGRRFDYVEIFKRTRRDN